MATILTEIVENKRLEVARSKIDHPVSGLQSLLTETKPRSLAEALNSKPFSVIAEIKIKAPSRGVMIPENVEKAPAVYEKSNLISAMSVLTDEKYFGMSLQKLREIRAQVSKPILRKDFIVDEYQIYEARAWGADAILLMATILSVDELKRFYAIASDVGLDVLFEAHDLNEIRKFPSDAKICGINSRKFKTSKARFFLARLTGAFRDLSIDRETYELRNHLPANSIHVAESGLDSTTVDRVVKLGYRAALVGNSLLLSQDGIEKELKRFEDAVAAK